jgi:hypothetical protein
MIEEERSVQYYKYITEVFQFVSHTAHRVCKWLAPLSQLSTNREFLQTRPSQWGFAHTATINAKNCGFNNISK